MLKTKISDVVLESCMYNASGCLCTSKKDLENLDKSNAGAMISKSCTYISRIGNPHPRYYENELGSINSTGLANNGYLFYKNLADGFSKPFILSIATLNWSDVIYMVNDYSTYPKNCNLVEINVSCPNVEGTKQLAYDTNQLNKLLTHLGEYKGIQYGLKLPPFFSPHLLEQVSEVLLNHEHIKFITCCNSLGNCLILNPDTLKPSIKPRSGLGGVGGDYCKPVCLANVYQFYKYLKGKIDIVGCGGIKTGQDVVEYIAAGACAVQIGTHYVKNGAKCFEEIEKEVEVILKERDVKNIMDLQGTAHSF
jgi:dihydroorotate dehydrogenase (fumarate)